MLRRQGKLQHSRKLKTKNYQLSTSRRDPAPHGRRWSTRAGSLLLDALLSIAIFGVIVGAFSSGISGGQQGTIRGGNRTRAAYLAEEGLEALRSIRDKTGGFAVISDPLIQNQDKGVQLVGSDWTIAASPTMIDNLFTRKVVFSDVSPADPDIRKVTATVSWTEIPGNQLISVSVESYLTNWQSNPPPPVPDWGTPNLRGFVLGTSNGTLNVATLEDIEVVGNYAFAANSGSANQGLIIYDVSNITSPTFSSAIASLPAFDIAISGDYAYLATSDTSNELKIFDISNPLSVTLAGQVDLTSDGAARGLYILGSSLYIAREQSAGPEIYVYDIGAPNETAPVLVTTIESDTPPPGSTRDMFAIFPGTAPYVYTATNEITNELTASDTTTALITGGGEVPGGRLNAKSVFVFNNGVFLGGGGTGGGDSTAYEFFSFDISSTPGNPNAVVGHYDTGAETEGSEAVNDIAASPSLSLAFMATDTRRGGVNHYFHVLDISTLDNLDSLAKKIYDGDIAAGYETYKGIFYRESDHTAFLVGGDEFTSGSDLLILQPTYN